MIFIPLLFSFVRLGGQATQAPAIERIVPSGTHPVAFTSGYQFTEGPVWTRENHLIWSDILGDTIYEWVGGKAIAKIKPSHRAIGNTLDQQGRIISCQQTTRSVVRYEKNGKVTVLADRFEGKRFNHPDDVIVRSDGTIYFTDPSFALKVEDKEQPVDGVYKLGTDGKVELLLKEYSKPNGLCFSPDEKYLYVNDTLRRQIYVYDLDAAGELGKGRFFAVITGEMAGQPNGMKVDIEGNVYCTGPGGIQVFQPSGKYLGTIAMIDVVSNFCFGDVDRKTLYITAGKSLFKLRVKIPGAPIPHHA